MGELHLPRLRGAVGFIADSSWREHRIEVFHDLPGQLVGQNSLNIGCGKQFGGCALPCSDTIDVVSHFPKVTRHSLSDNLFCAFFLVQHPNAVLFVQTQCFVVHVAPGHKNAGGLAHTLALHDPAGIGRTHQTVGACNLLERIVCGLFAQMVDLIDYIRIHVSQIGGITPARKVIAFCDAYGVRTAWHGPIDMTPIGHAVNAHLDISCPNLGVQEWTDGLSGLYPTLNGRLMQEIFPGMPERRDGYLYLNDKPGIGVDINEELAARYPCKNTGVSWNWMLARLPDGTAVRP